MAKAATEEQLQLRRRARRRLIGAVALVTLLAVVLPWILEGEPRRSDQEISIEIPSPDSRDFASGAGGGAPAGRSLGPAGAMSAGADPGKSQAPDGSAGAPAASRDAPKAEQQKPPAPGVPSRSPAAAKAPGAAKQTSAEPRTASENTEFVVQIAALADAKRARTIQKALAGKGVRAYTERVKTAAGEVTRVRVGPFPNRQKAEQSRAKLKTLGYDGDVTPR